MMVKPIGMSKKTNFLQIDVWYTVLVILAVNKGCAITRYKDKVIGQTPNIFVINHN